MKDLNAASAFIHAIVDVQRGVKKPPDERMPFYGTSQVRKGLQKIEVVEEIVGKLLSLFWVLLP
ncbi:MAG TPA: hypothetical protein VGZ73_04145 [Bryobacteraceae bacterium]|jgi:hypothetical protein|nr:hypothetical protein [Bryobacteraceae bacterium]